MYNVSFESRKKKIMRGSQNIKINPLTTFASASNRGAKKQASHDDVTHRYCGVGKIQA
jgi:hypothetical protein